MVRSWNPEEIRQKISELGSQYFFEIWSVESSAFSGSWIASQRGDRGKTSITLSLGLRLKCRKKWSQVNRLKFLGYQFQGQRKKKWHVASRTSSLYWTSPELGHCGRLDTTLSWSIKIRSDRWHWKEASEGYYRAEFQISKIFKHRDNTISLSSSSKLVKGVYFFFPNCISLVWRIKLNWLQGPIVE